MAEPLLTRAEQQALFRAARAALRSGLSWTIEGWTGARPYRLPHVAMQLFGPTMVRVVGPWAGLMSPDMAHDVLIAIAVMGGPEL